LSLLLKQPRAVAVWFLTDNRLIIKKTRSLYVNFY
jgi:hypothetical protein